MAPYLRECLEQLHKQSCNSAEFIVVDDGSTDESKQICDEYQANDSRFKVIHLPKNQGLLRVRKIGIEHSSGRYLIFLDGDDYLSSTESLNHLIHTMGIANCDIGGFPVTVFGIDDSRCKSMLQHLSFERAGTFTSSLDILQAIYGEHSVMSWTIWNKCYQSKVLKEAVKVIPNEHIVMAEDAFLVFIFACCSECFKVLNIPPVTNYRLGTGVSTRFPTTAEQFKVVAKTVRVIRLLQRISKVKKLSTIHAVLIERTLFQLLRNTLYAWQALPNKDKPKAFEYILMEGFYNETLRTAIDMFSNSKSNLLEVMEGTSNFINSLHKRGKETQPYYKRITHILRKLFHVIRAR